MKVFIALLWVEDVRGGSALSGRACARQRKWAGGQAAIPVCQDTSLCTCVAVGFVAAVMDAEQRNRS